MGYRADKKSQEQSTAPDPAEAPSAAGRQDPGDWPHLPLTLPVRGGLFAGLPDSPPWTPDSSALNGLFEKTQVREMLQSAHGDCQAGQTATSPQDPHIKALLKPGVPYPQAQAAGLLGCMVSSYPGLIERITSTHDHHKPLDPHSQDQAADITTRDPRAAMAAGAACGAVYQQDEYAHPSAGSSGPHVHLQTRPGRGGARGPYFP